jgi:hypothetical protein
MDGRQAMLTRLYEALSRRDIPGALETLHADADLPDQLEGGRIVGHEALRAYWLGAFDLIVSESAVASFQPTSEDEGIVRVHHHVTGVEGGLWTDSETAYRVWFRDGLIARMETVGGAGEDR